MDQQQARIKILLAKTALDGHWRGVSVVARALREADMEVILVGMALAEEIVAAARDEDVDVVGLNVGGRIEVVERVLDLLMTEGLNLPVLAGGTIAPKAAALLRARGVAVFPPGSALPDIVAAVRTLAAEKQGREGKQE